MVEQKSDENVQNKIVSQLEFYFGDYNLRRDKFLKEEVTKEEGYVPIPTLLTFFRLKKIVGEGQDDKKPANIVAEAVKKVGSSLIELSEDGEKIRRKPELPVPEINDEYRKELNARTVHLKGFSKDNPPTIDELQEFCKKFGDVEAIEVRRDLRPGKNRKFKGCIMVLYKSVDSVAKILATEDLKYGDSPLLKEDKNQYFERKKEFYESRAKAKVEKKESKKQNDSKDGKEKNGTKEEGDEEDEEANDEEAEDDQDEEADEKIVSVKGAVLKLCGVPEGVSFVDIKKIFNQHSRVVYVEDINEAKESYVRFELEGAAQTALDKAKVMKKDDPNNVYVELNGADVKAEVLEGDDELKFWKKLRETKARAYERRGQHKRNGPRRSSKKWNQMKYKVRGRYHGKRGAGESGDGGSKPKQVKQES